MRVAKSYDGATIICTFEKDGRSYARIRDKCDRCNGSGIYYVGTLNGKGIPATPDAGVCYRCFGVGFEQQDVRLYTEQEYQSIERAKERAAEKASKARAEREKEYIEEQNLRMMQRHGFEGIKAYAVVGNTFDIIDELKENGAKYSPSLRWICPTEPTWLTTHLYSEITLTDVFTMTENGMFVLKDDAEDFIEALEPITGGFLGNKGERITVVATLMRRVNFATRFGQSYIYIFETANGETLVWTTGSAYIYDGTYSITGTVKEHNIYKRVRQTVLTRCKIEGV